jgi:hypothetical protein
MAESVERTNNFFLLTWRSEGTKVQIPYLLSSFVTTFLVPSLQFPSAVSPLSACSSPPSRPRFLLSSFHTSTNNAGRKPPYAHFLPFVIDKMVWRVFCFFFGCGWHQCIVPTVTSFAASVLYYRVWKMGLLLRNSSWTRLYILDAITLLYIKSMTLSANKFWIGKC